MRGERIIGIGLPLVLTTVLAAGCKPPEKQGETWTEPTPCAKAGPSAEYPAVLFTCDEVDAKFRVAGDIIVLISAVDNYTSERVIEVPPGANEITYSRKGCKAVVELSEPKAEQSCKRVTS